MILVAVVVGLLVGVTLGALGGGGSILTVPALVYLLGQDAHGATTVSLAVVGATALAGMAAHARAQRVRFADGAVFGSLGIAGSVVGSRLSAGVEPSVLLTGFAALMLVAAAAMTARRRSVDAVPVPAGRGAPVVVPAGAGGEEATLAHPRRGRVVLVAVASGVGLLTGFFGVGGGFVVVPALVLVLGFEMPVAVGTSLLVIAVNSAASLVSRLGTPVHADWPRMAVFAAAAVAGALAGTRVASIVRPRLLRTAFTALVVVVALYTAARSIPHLV